MSDPFSDLNPAVEPAPASPASPTSPSAATAEAAPTESGATVAYPETPRSGATALAPARASRPLFGTIFWGIVLLTFAAFMVITTLFPVNLDPTLWLVGSVIVIGLLLVVAGIAAGSRRAG
jgi:hypothetical protein